MNVRPFNKRKGPRSDMVKEVSVATQVAVTPQISTYLQVEVTIFKICQHYLKSEVENDGFQKGSLTFIIKKKWLNFLVVVTPVISSKLRVEVAVYETCQN